MNKFIKVDISVIFISFDFTKVVFFCVFFQDWRCCYNNYIEGIKNKYLVEFQQDTPLVRLIGVRSCTTKNNKTMFKCLT